MDDAWPFNVCMKYLEDDFPDQKRTIMKRGGTKRILINKTIIWNLSIAFAWKINPDSNTNEHPIDAWNDYAILFGDLNTIVSPPYKVCKCGETRSLWDYKESVEGRFTNWMVDGMFRDNPLSGVLGCKPDG